MSPTPAVRLSVTTLSLLVLLLAAAIVVRRQPIAQGFASTNLAPSGTFTGFIGGAQYLIEIPPAWNGTLLLFSHGLVPPTSKNPPQDAPDRPSAVYLLGQHYALAGSSYSQTGWAVAQALHDQIALLNYFDSRFGKPVRTIAWGQSLGGLITAGLVQRHPNRFTAAMPMCGAVAGSIATWNLALDGEFALQTLLDPKHQMVSVVHIANPIFNILAAEALVTDADLTARGRARVALAAALSDIPGWYNAAAPPPAASNFAAQLANQVQWLKQQDVPLSFGFRTEVELRAGGNPSWNTGIDYARQLAISVDQPEVQALYRQAGMSLQGDLNALQRASRIAADPAAQRYLEQNIVLNGRLPVPFLAMHTIGDGLVPVEEEQAFQSTVRGAGKGNLLRQLYINRAGHCTFTPAEEIVGLRLLIDRLNVGHWSGVRAVAALNGAAAALGTRLNPRRPAFVTYRPAGISTTIRRAVDGLSGTVSVRVASLEPIFPDQE